MRDADKESRTTSGNGGRIQSRTGADKGRLRRRQMEGGNTPHIALRSTAFS
jgi:hypothetical protein